MLTQLQTIWSLMRGHRLRYGFAMLSLGVASLLAYGVPLVGSATIDYAISQKDITAETSGPILFTLDLMGGVAFLRDNLWVAPVAMLLLSGISGLFNYLKGWHAAKASDAIARNLKNELYDHLNHLPASYHDNADTGDLVQRCTSDVETTRTFLTNQVMDIGRAVILTIIALPLLLSIDRAMTGMSFILFLPIMIYGFVYFRSVQKSFKLVAEAEGELTSVVQENLTGIRVVRAFSRHDHEREKFAKPNAAYRDNALYMIKLMSRYWGTMTAVTETQFGITLIAGCYWITTGRITVGILFAFLSYLAIMIWPIRQLGRILTNLGKTIVSLKRIRTILAVEREPEPASPHVSSEAQITGRIEVSDLHFSHKVSESPSDGRGAINGISFAVKPGETLAILGPSGSGKSTLMHLLLRLYDYKQGSIKFDGSELSTINRKWLRNQIGVVMQEPFLFSKSLRENLRLGHGAAADQEIESAAQDAFIHDTILGFEKGYETVIGERGVTLSGGQRQRVAIARAVLKRPPLLILDDAMSAIDAETETLILDALKTRRGRATTLVIAHRLATLVHADRIIVLEHGQIIQTGTHDELAAAEGLYRRLWQIQTNVESDFQAESNPA